MSERSIEIGVKKISYGDCENGALATEFQELIDIYKGSVVS